MPLPDDRAIFDLLERGGERGHYPLNENHWSNVVAWLLDPSAGHGLDAGFASLLWEAACVHVAGAHVESVEREAYHQTNGRFVDVEVSLSDGRHVLIEIKIDPDYQDAAQVQAQADLLGEDDFLLVIGPMELGGLSTDVGATIAADQRIRYVCWRSLGEKCQGLLSDTGQWLARVLLEGLARYWVRHGSTTFSQMVEILAREKQWDRFYPDAFKEVFILRFPAVWEQWVAERPQHGNGNPHQYLALCLAMLTRRRQGFRLDYTGETRQPNDPAWGYGTIREYRVISEQ